MRRLVLYSILVVLIFFILSAVMYLIWSDFITGIGNSDKPVIHLLYTSAGSMPELLNTSQIDAFITYEPVVSTAVLGGIGNEIAQGSDLPPPGKWNNTACNVLVMSDDLVGNDHEVASLISALITAGIERVNDQPQMAENISAQWVFGSGPIISAGAYLDPLEVENRSFPSLIFTPDAEIPNITDTFTSNEDYSSIIEQIQEKSSNNSVFYRGIELLAGSKPNITGDIPTLNIGYLPSCDHYAPLYVAVQDSEYFCDKYGFCLVPPSTEHGRPTHCSLNVDGKAVADVNLVQGSSGGGLMTNMGQGAINIGCLGSVPAEQEIVSGNPAFIIQSINAGGTGLVVNKGLPCSDWNDFVSEIKKRAAEKNPVKIAAVQSSIQEEILLEALQYENIRVSLY